MKTLVLDADGMIVHGERFSARLARDYGISTDTTGHFFRNEFQLCLVGKADLKQELQKHLEVWGWDKGVDALLDYWFADTYNLVDERFAPIIQQLRQRGVKAYLATNNEKYRTDNLLEHRGLGKWFDDVFSSAYVGLKKPDAAFFQHIIEKTGADKNDLTFWDDDPENTDGAAAFGMPIEIYKDFDQFKQIVEKLL